MAARANELGDVGESSPANWEQPLGSGDVHVAIAALSPDAARLEAVLDRARRAHQELPGVELIWRQDCYQLPTGRTSFGFKDGIGQPAVEGSGIPPTNPKERPLKAGEIILGYPDETGELPPMPSPGRTRSKRHLRRLPQTAHEGRGIPAISPGEGHEPRRGGTARRQDARTLAERRSTRAHPRPRRSRPRRRPAAEQRLLVRRRPPRLQVSRRLARPPSQPTGRARRTRAVSMSGCIA